jgi:predicted nucleic acid-binding protein
MKIDDALSSLSRLYMETAPFIYYTESRAIYVDKMRAVFREVSGGHLQVMTSAVTIPETLMKPLQSNDMMLVNRYRTMFYRTRGISVIPVTSTAGNIAAELRARYNLRTPDALHIASAVDVGCQAFLTNDAALKRVKEISVLILDDLELPQQNS